MRFVRLWLPVILWTALILSASTDLFSASQTSRLALRLFGDSVPEIVHFLVRKAAHIFEYSVLAYLAWRAHRTMTVPLLTALAVSSADEWLQSRTVARTGTVWDVVLDVCSAFIVLALLKSRSTRLTGS